MIQNKICDNCNHLSVCNKLTTIEKFNSDSKSFIGVDIEIIRCDDFVKNSDIPTD